MKRMVLNNQVLFGTVNADRGAFESAIQHLAEFDRRWPKQVRALITGPLPGRGAPVAAAGQGGRASRT